MKLYKHNILLGSQVPGLKQSLAYIDGKLPPNYPMPAIPNTVGVTCCKGLIGECVNCIWPNCE